MSDFVILGTDTNAGKTTFAMLWMAAFGSEYAYWKPLESGESDSETVRRLVPQAIVYPPLLSFRQPIAPLLAGRLESIAIPPAEQIASSRPQSARPVLVETFGSPLSPLNEDELQIELIRELALPCVLVDSGTVGAIGRCLQCLGALANFGIVPMGVVMIGLRNPFALEQIGRHWKAGKVWVVQSPDEWDEAGIGTSAALARPALLELRSAVARQELTPMTTDLVDRDRRTVWHPYTSLGDTDRPLVCVGAKDEFLELGDGRRVIDAISSWWTILHGHRHPILMAALQEAGQKYDHVHFAGVTHAPAVELAELLLQTIPWPKGRVFFSDDGSTAVEVALKMAYQFWCHQGQPQRTRFVGFEHGYHGDTFGAMAVSRDPLFFGRFEPLLFQSSIVPLTADALDAELTRYAGATAAVIVEPLVQGAGGMRLHTPGLLHDLAETARRHGVLFIADEVMTGGGRTGTLWAHQTAQIVPDLICAGKTLAGGILPLAATLAAPHIVEAFQTHDRARTFFHGHSFTANPLACAVAVANWKKLMPGAAGLAMRLEAFWRQTLVPLRQAAGVRDVRIQGSIAAIELAEAGGYLAPLGRHIRDLCLERGVLVRPLGNVVYAMPPLVTCLDSLQQIADAIKAALQSL